MYVCVYANDLSLNVEHCQMHMYADDVQLYINCTVDDVPNCIRLINWASANGLGLNPKKSAVLIIGQPKTFMTYLPPIHINNVNINLVESVKNLRVILNKQLNWWSDHIKANCGKTFAFASQSLDDAIFHTNSYPNALSQNLLVANSNLWLSAVC